MEIAITNLLCGFGAVVIFAIVAVVIFGILFQSRIDEEE